MRALLLASSALLALGLTVPANATIMQTSTLPAGPFTSPIPNSSTPTVITGLTTSVDNQYRSPFFGTANDGSPYTAIEGSGSATFNSTGNTLSFIWGSPDTYNNLYLYSGANDTGSLLATINGASIAPANGTSYSYVTISDFGTFGSFKFDNSGNPGAGSNAFEISTLSVSSVPLPASLPMFGGAVLALGLFGAWKRSSAATRA